MASKIQISSMNTRQKITAGVFVVIILILLWQVYKMFGGSSEAPKPVTTAKPTAPKTQTGPSTPTPPAPGTPQQAQLIKPQVPMTPEEQALFKLQEETQAKYLTAVSELQMLKVARDIAETNQAIMTARLSTVTSQKKIVDMLTPQPPPQPAPTPTPTQIVPITTIPKQTTLLMGRQQNEEVQYVVVSVAQIQYRWSAVLGAKGVLYNVHIGDVLPLDNSKVVNIDRSGVVIQRRGVRKRLSLVPII
jgi:hypothetical protein